MPSSRSWWGSKVRQFRTHLRARVSPKERAGLATWTTPSQLEVFDAMHIAATKPMAVSREQVPADVIEKERGIAAARAAESGKPANIVDKMVEGAVAKFLAEVTLLSQPFVKNDKQTVADLVKSHGAKVHGFVLYVVGEGIEKRKDDFAAEVAAMARG